MHFGILNISCHQRTINFRTLLSQSQGNQISFSMARKIWNRVSYCWFFGLPNPRDHRITNWDHRKDLFWVNILTNLRRYRLLLTNIRIYCWLFTNLRIYCLLLYDFKTLIFVRKINQMILNLVVNHLSIWLRWLIRIYIWRGSRSLKVLLNGMNFRTYKILE
jgi:hypothetical protein